MIYQRFGTEIGKKLMQIRTFSSGWPVSKMNVFRHSLQSEPVALKNLSYKGICHYPRWYPANWTTQPRKSARIQHSHAEHEFPDESSQTSQVVEANDTAILTYGSNVSTMFYNSVTVTKTWSETLFAGIGLGIGHLGIQSPHSGGNSQAVFFLMDTEYSPFWSPAWVNVVDEAPAVLQQRFDNGHISGTEVVMEFPWEVNKTIEFVMTFENKNQQSHYSGYLFWPSDNQWKLMATLRRPNIPGTVFHLQYFESFIEKDHWLPDEISARAATYDPWMKPLPDTSPWIQVEKAVFTQLTPAFNVNAGVKEDRFFVEIGGTTKNEMMIDSMKRKTKTDLPPNLAAFKTGKTESTAETESTGSSAEMSDYKVQPRKKR